MYIRFDQSIGVDVWVLRVCASAILALAHPHTHAFANTSKTVCAHRSDFHLAHTRQPFRISLFFPFGYGKSITLVGFRRHLAYMRVLSMLKIQIDFLSAGTKFDNNFVNLFILLYSVVFFSLSLLSFIAAFLFVSTCVCLCVIAINLLCVLFVVVC